MITKFEATFYNLLYSFNTLLILVATSLKTLKFTTIKHIGVPFRTVSRGSRVPQGQFSEGSEKVREGQRGLQKVGEGLRKLEEEG